MERRPRLERWQKAECFRCQSLEATFVCVEGSYLTWGDRLGLLMPGIQRHPQSRRWAFFAPLHSVKALPGTRHCITQRRWCAHLGPHAHLLPSALPPPASRGRHQDLEGPRQRHGLTDLRYPFTTHPLRRREPSRNRQVGQIGRAVVANFPTRRRCFCRRNRTCVFYGTESPDSTRASGTSPAFPPPFHRRCFRGGLCFFARHPSSCDHRILKRWWGGCPPLTIDVRTRYHNGLGLPWEASRTPPATSPASHRRIGCIPHLHFLSPPLHEHLQRNRRWEALACWGALLERLSHGNMTCTARRPHAHVCLIKIIHVHTCLGVSCPFKKYIYIFP